MQAGRRQIDAFYVAGDVFGLEAGAEHSFSAEAVIGSSVSTSYSTKDPSSSDSSEVGCRPNKIVSIEPMGSEW